MGKTIYLLDHFLSLFDTVAHPIAVTEASGEILFINSEFEELTTLKLDIIKGMCIDNLFPAEQKRKIAASLSIASQQDKDFIMREHRIMIRRKSRRQVPVDLHMSKIQVDSRKLLVFSFSDLTAIDAVQRENERNLNEIMHLSRLADIGRLSAGIAHELNNPLQVIMGLSENVKALIEDEEPDHDKLLEQIDPLLVATSKMASVIRNMMKMARQEEIDMEVFHLTEIVEASLSMVKGRVDSAKLSIDVDVPPEAKVFCNSNQLEQILINLFANAIDSMEEVADGEKKLSISFEETSREYSLNVTNNGKMIPKDVQQDIMSPFFTTKPAGKGTGLGLFVSFGIAKAHGGVLKLKESNVKETTFSLVLPRPERGQVKKTKRKSAA